MKIKILTKYLLFIIAIIGISNYSIFTSENLTYSNLPEPVKQVIIKHKVTPEKQITILPIRLKIPKIGVNAIAINVGITSKGLLDVPKNIVNVGLYSLGVFPGEKGSAVIDGHYGWINGKGAVFNNLNKLKKGDKIYFHNDKGVIITFIVNKIKIYKQNEEASEIFISKDGKAHLNIITCQGVWNKKTKAYPNRLVVFADMEIK